MTESRATRVARRSSSGLLLGVAVALLIFQEKYREFEAVLASKIFAIGDVSTFTRPDASVVIFQLADRRVFGLEISPECSSAFLIAPFMAVGAAMLLRPRLHPLRVGVGVGLVGLLLVLCNQMRVGLIAGLIQQFGLRVGYRWGHLVLGSLLTIIFVAGCLALLIWVVTSGRSKVAPAVAR